VPDGRALLREVTDVVGDPDEARWIVAHALGATPARLALRLGEPVGAGESAEARLLAKRRATGEPLQHVLGSWGFRTLDVRVDGRALVPRPETEQVVEAALLEARRLWRSSSSLLATDLGTGSGVIALSLALEGPPGIQVWATDVSAAALELAGANLETLAASNPAAAARVHLAAGSWFAALPARLRGAVDLVVSNPPYVSEGEWETLPADVRHHDPYGALVAGPDGLEATKLIVTEAPQWMAAHGVLVLELAPHRATEAADLATRSGFAEVELRPDLSGRHRVLVARRSPA
jgi:release factor glutamine methyltransferase